MQLQERPSEALYQIMFARYYSSGLGRFLAVDPSDKSIVRENPQSWNRYTYALNNPLRFTDPDGKAYVSQDGQAEHNKVVQDPKRSATEKAVAVEGATSPQPIDVEKSPDAKIIIQTSGGVLEMTASPAAVEGMAKSEQQKGNFKMKARAEDFDANVDAKTGTIVDAKLTIYEGTWEISTEGKSAGKSKAEFVTDTFIHGTAHVSGPTVRSEPTVKNLLGY